MPKYVVFLCLCMCRYGYCEYGQNKDQNGQTRARDNGKRSKAEAEEGFMLNLSKLSLKIHHLTNSTLGSILEDLE